MISIQHELLDTDPESINPDQISIQHEKCWIRIMISIQHELLDTDPESINPDPKHLLQYGKSFIPGCQQGFH